MTEPLRPIEWTGSSIRVIDQTALPGRLVYLSLERVDQLVDAITRLAVRGAPQLGAVGALGVVLAMDEAARGSWDPAQLGCGAGDPRRSPDRGQPRLGRRSSPPPDDGGP